MKTIPFVPTVEITDPLGQPVLKKLPAVPGREPELVPHTLSHLESLLQAVADPVFVEGLDGGAAVELIYDTRKELKAQAGTTEARGHWLIEQNDTAARIQRAILKPTNGYNGALAHNFVEFIRAARAMADAPAPLAQAAE